MQLKGTCDFAPSIARSVRQYCAALQISRTSNEGHSYCFLDEILVEINLSINRIGLHKKFHPICWAVRLMKNKTRFHEEFHRQEAHVGASDRGFGFVFAGVCAIVGAINYWNGHDWWPWWLAAATIFLALALVWPRALSPLNWLWTKFGLLLHSIVQPVVMGLIFFTTIVPMGLLFRAMGKDFLRGRYDRSARSYWIERTPPGPSPDSFKNQF